MDNRGKRQAPSLFGGMGFYIALLVTVVAAGVMGYFALLDNDPAPADNIGGAETVDNVEDSSTTPVVSPEKDDATPVMSDDEPLIVTYPTDKPDLTEETDSGEEPEETGSTEPGADIPVSGEVTVPDIPPAETTPVSSKIVLPLVGDTVAVFSVDQLMYDETLGDWRTHDGIDIRAEAGTFVVATAAGTVLSVDEDERLGVTVRIEHDGGYVTTYASLHPETQVEVGQQVAAGDVIGAVGNTSLSEAGLGAHLHFSVTRNGKNIDPEAYLPKES